MGTWSDTAVLSIHFPPPLLLLHPILFAHEASTIGSLLKASATDVVHRAALLGTGMRDSQFKTTHADAALGASIQNRTKRFTALWTRANRLSSPRL